MKKIICIITLSMASIGHSHGKDQIALGIPNHDCQNWNVSRTKAAFPLNISSRATYQAWVLGYLSGVNSKEDIDLLNEVSRKDIGQWLDSYCAGNPKHSLTSATQSLVIALRDSGGKTPALKTNQTLTSDGTTLVAPSDEILANGRSIYLKNCSACHQMDGRGIQGVFKPLINANIITDKVSTLQPIMFGKGAIMPAYWRSLSIQEISAVANFVRNSWGNRSTGVIEDNDVLQILKAH